MPLLPLHDDVLRRLSRARARMHDEPGSPLSLRVLSREACLSEHHFMRTFSLAYGVTPGRYLSELRIAHAKELLSRGVPVTEACFEVGFASLGSFSSRFKRETGLAPRAFQQHMRTLGAVPVRLSSLYVPACFVAWFDPTHNVHFGEVQRAAAR